jgi:hypothetical protein
MPDRKRTPDELPSTALVLAAIDRAERHRAIDEPGVLLSEVKEHLGLRHNGWTTRRLRPQLEELQHNGLAVQLRRNCLNLWGLTAEGRQRLDTVRQAGGFEPLPESPQHRKWREARHAAEQKITVLREELRRALDDGRLLIEAGHHASSSEWFTFSERLGRACWRVGSASYCLHEWAEPDDDHPDIDQPPYRQHGRRETQRWDDG